MDLKHWKYFLLIEQDFIQTTRYVELSPANFNTFSIEYTKIIFTACSEIDVLCKQLCVLLGNNNADNMNIYRTEILNKYPKISTVAIDVTPDVSLIPWKEWTLNKSPEWWKNYNSIKHERTLNFGKSNLKTALDCTAGLMVIVLYYYKQLYGKIPDQSTQLFDDNFFPAHMITESGTKKLPDF